MNTKKLYQADGYAVQELLKITTLLYEAQLKSSENSTQGETHDDLKFDISDKINELKTTRQLASELTINGATLFDLLGREAELREIRNSKVSRQFDTSEIEMALKETIDNAKREIEDTRKQINNVKVRKKLIIYLSFIAMVILFKQYTVRKLELLKTPNLILSTVVRWRRNIDLKFKILMRNIVKIN